MLIGNLLNDGYYLYINKLWDDGLTTERMLALIIPATDTIH